MWGSIFANSFFLVLAPFLILIFDVIAFLNSCGEVALEILDYHLTLVEKMEGWATILQDLDKLEEWEDQNLTEFNKDVSSCPGRLRNPCNTTIWWQRKWGAALPERPWSGDLHMNQQQRQPSASLAIWKGERTLNLEKRSFPSKRWLLDHI